MRQHFGRLVLVDNPSRYEHGADEECRRHECRDYFGQIFDIHYNYSLVPVRSYSRQTGDSMQIPVIITKTQASLDPGAWMPIQRGAMRDEMAEIFYYTPPAITDWRAGFTYPIFIEQR